MLMVPQTIYSLLFYKTLRAAKASRFSYAVSSILEHRKMRVALLHLIRNRHPLAQSPPHFNYYGRTSRHSGPLLFILHYIMSFKPLRETFLITIFHPGVYVSSAVPKKASIKTRRVPSTQLFPFLIQNKPSTAVDNLVPSRTPTTSSCICQITCELITIRRLQVGAPDGRPDKHRRKSCIVSFRA